MDYKASGVDIDKGNRFAKKIKELVGVLPKNGTISSIGGFSALVDLDGLGCNLILSSSTDGVGTKLLVAQHANKHDTVGIDLVAMNVNDIIATGTEPYFFLDYISYSDVEDKVLEDIAKGIVDGLELSECSLVGGETAQMADVYKKGEYDLAGFCVGVGKKEDILPKPLKEGMVLIGFESSGFHSNGYSLLRKVFFDIHHLDLYSEFCGKPLAEILLKPTSIYVKLFKSVKPYVKALIHITGGGFYDNIPRVLSSGVNAILEKDKLPEVDIFKAVQDMGNVEENEMFRTFNMGIGMIAICENRDKEKIIEASKYSGIKSYEIGFLIKGRGELKIV